jgi:prepilin-type N-terminal cleavage/methylation domain-containing protein
MSYIEKSKKCRQASRGFTVIEVIITMAIFSIVMGVVIQIFIFTTRTQRRSRSMQEAYAQGRAAVEALAREGQNGSVDYSFYSEPLNEVSLTAQPVAIAAFRDSQGQTVRFRCVERLAAAAVHPCDAETSELGQVQLCRGSGCDSGSWAGITDEATDITGWRTWLGPVKNPFSRDPDNASLYLENIQPWVTAAITVQPAAVAGAQLAPVHLQSTVSSRTYLR